VVPLLPVSSGRLVSQAAACGRLARRRIEFMGGTSQRAPKDRLDPPKILAVLHPQKWGVTLRGVRPGQPVSAVRAQAISLAWIFHALSEESRAMFARPAKDSPADSGPHRGESAES
jgi:hypothetical protein